ncbi:MULTISPECIES: 4-(cytidine 5'-diphospho)-2-C-methyl-D-erythritol kinase [unclassified Rhizobium]|uniref:4-(cytidine 5'-diphospho)-2-C-methyl-D-erythritol kinase n=1 Tax=unclassified Rhizobium TaxID=2613769 RepID=UPI0007154EE1|nr:MULTISPECIES: 4-(cytidine 5'-diphospho)-2-C-methyl-D-erythritol kinase [unclassified Rhizobium]KQS96227.1 4-diphosphocytidyl-2C-methyl-D-erythritol kinase [Rhizobium sp. Leaf386]KQT06065.1 4-diphosphocytidyl-2C-methyl-D-erythritol kinase [Rhizobium sp. Leaf391]KQU09698.1 4-diphosphocytidyl-2C-methyl-D-erythritol kinase [Rhizobium sp. Leaf453]
MTRDAGIGSFALNRVAPAKINLALHVVGQRADGYHLLDSLVTFADAGDRIGFSISHQDRLTISGRFAADLPAADDASAENNLVLKARDLLRANLAETGIPTGPVHLHLEKNLPVSSGIGGGSADAAATLLGLMDLWEAPVAADSLLDIALKLGADVPMCLKGTPLFARGIGEDIALLPNFPSFPMLLVNPLKAVSTPVIFRMLTSKTNPPLNMPDTRTRQAGWMRALGEMRNDLEPPARQLEPAISAVSDALKKTGAAFVRMSGSGASCFGLFATAEGRDAAAGTLSRQNPNWYVLACSSVGKKEDHDGRD